MGNIIELIEVTEAVYTASSLPEDTASAWNSGTTYAQGDRAYILANHTLYESAVNGNVGNDPSASDATLWLEVGSTNKWAPFDQSTGQACVSSGDMSFTLTAPRICTGMGLFGIVAVSVRVRVTDINDVKIYDETFQLVDGSGITDWFSFYTYDPVYIDHKIIEGFFAMPGYEIQIDLDGGGGGTEVGEIGVGRVYYLGDTAEPASGDLIRVNPIARNDFGKITSVDRGFYETLKLEIAVPAGNELNVIQVTRRQGSSPCILYPSTDLTYRIPPIYGVLTSVPRTWQNGKSPFEIEITSMV